MATSESVPIERRSLARFAWKAALMLPPLALVPLVNYSVDPANLFVKQGEQEAMMADSLLAGRRVVNFERYDDRQIATALLGKRTGHANVLILGSSRTLNVRGNLFPQSKFINGSMLASTVRELLAAYGIVHRSGLHPDTVIVGIDPWMLNAEAYDSRWISIEPQFKSALQMLGLRSWPTPPSQAQSQGKLSALFSADYFQQSFRRMLTKEAKPKWYTSSADENQGFTRLPDGSYTYSQEERTKSQVAVDAKAEKYAADKIYMLNDGARVDSTLLHSIRRLLETVRKDGAVPILYLPPYHPIVYARIVADEKHRIVKDAEAVLRKVGSELNVQVLGSYDPAALGLSNLDFYDGHHLKEPGLAKIFTVKSADGLSGN